MNKEKGPCLRFLLTPYLRITYIFAHSLGFSSCGTMFLFYNTQVMWRHVERPIQALNQNCQSSLKSRGTWCNRIGRQIVYKMI